MSADWNDYQEEVAEFFRSLGLSATTNVSVEGARTRHDVDVVVLSRHAGFDIRWLVECKAWRTPIPKEKVLALRSIVDDTGADRGFLMAERGYQKGALEAARFANVMLTSLGDLRETLAYDLGVARLKSLLHRVEVCRERYWNISKEDRIDLDLRADVGIVGYSGDVVMTAVEHTTRQALFSGFPVKYNRALSALSASGGRGAEPVDASDGDAIATPLALFDTLVDEVAELEQRLDSAENALRARAGDTTPRDGGR